jgi:hypothetical protein
MKKYTIAQLLDIFEKHSKQMRDMEMERCKGKSVYIEPDFLITDALHSICDEIRKLQGEKS